MTKKPSDDFSLSLLEFSNTMPKNGKCCHICLLPEIKEINDAIRGKTVAYPTIVKWLLEVKKHEGITLSKLKYHITARHVVKE